MEAVAWKLSRGVHAWSSVVVVLLEKPRMLANLAMQTPCWPPPLHGRTGAGAGAASAWPCMLG
eukprot:355619-Chlamydomonas_euryale.AAC.6